MFKYLCVIFRSANWTFWYKKQIFKVWILSCSPKALCFLQVEWKRSHQTLFRDRSKHFSRVKKAKFTSSLLRRHVTWSKSSSQAHPSGQKAKEVWRRTVRRRSILVLNHLPPIMSRICTTNISQALWSVIGPDHMSEQDSGAPLSTAVRGQLSLQPNRTGRAEVGGFKPSAGNHHRPCRYRHFDTSSSFYTVIKHLWLR